LGILRCVLSALLLLFAPVAQAQIFTSYPFILQNGTIADAGQVMANFNQIANQVNANAATSGLNNNITTIAGLGNGSATLPSLTFANFATTGLFYDTVNGCLGITHAGVQVGCWNNTGLHLLPAQTTPSARDAATVAYVDSKQGVLLPQLRVSNSSTQFMPVASVTAATSIYYVPYNGTTAVYTDGAGNIFSTQLTSTLSQLLSDTTLSPAAAVAATVYDVYFWYHTDTTFTGVTTSGSQVLSTIGGITGGTGSLVVGAAITGPGIPVATTVTSIDTPTQIHISNNATASGSGTFSVNASLIKTFAISRGPAWTSGTVRGAAADQTTIQNGAYAVNLNAITNGPAAQAGLHIATIVTDSSGPTVSWLYGGQAGGGSPATFGVFNRYNRLPVYTTVQDTGQWAYNVAAYRIADGSTGNLVSFITGVADEWLSANYNVFAYNNNISCYSIVGIGFDITTNPGTSQIAGVSGFGSTQASVTSHRVLIPGIGAHFVAPIELVSCGTGSFVGNVGTIQFGGFFFEYRM